MPQPGMPVSSGPPAGYGSPPPGGGYDSGPGMRFGAAQPAPRTGLKSRTTVLIAVVALLVLLGGGVTAMVMVGDDNSANTSAAQARASASGASDNAGDPDNGTAGGSGRPGSGVSASAGSRASGGSLKYVAPENLCTKIDLSDFDKIYGQAAGSSSGANQGTASGRKDVTCKSNLSGSDGSSGTVTTTFSVFGSKADALAFYTNAENTVKNTLTAQNHVYRTQSVGERSHWYQVDNALKFGFYVLDQNAVLFMEAEGNSKMMTTSPSMVREKMPIIMAHTSSQILEKIAQ